MSRQRPDPIEYRNRLGCDRAAFGYVPNFTRLFAHRPAVYEAWLQLKDAISGSMDPRRYELVTMAAARNLRSSYCTLQHGKVLASRFLEPAQVRDLGLSDTDIFDVVVAAAAVLTVGRPIAESIWPA